MKSKIHLDPNDSYYREGANAWLVKLMDLIGDENARTATNEIAGTWREIRDTIQALVIKTYDEQLTALDKVTAETDQKDWMDKHLQSQPQIVDGNSSPAWFENIKPIEY